MLSRLSSRCYVCLRCQSRLAISNTTPSPRPYQNRSSIGKRWQSTSAATKPTEEDDDLRIIRIEEPSATKFRHWKPPPTADLGVNVLGKPGEILVLPDGGRKRKRTRRLEEEEEDETEGRDHEENADPSLEDNEVETPKQSIGEVLANESKPIPLTEVIESIKSVRKLAGKMKKYGPTAKSDNESTVGVMHKTLLGGFSRTQLKHYIEHTKPGGTKGYKHSRKWYVEFILHDLWNLPEIGGEGLQSTRRSAKFTTKSIYITPVERELLNHSEILNALRSQYPGISLSFPSSSGDIPQHRTQHTVPSKTYPVEIRGRDEASVKAFRSAFRASLQQICSRTLPLPQSLSERYVRVSKNPAITRTLQSRFQDMLYENRITLREQQQSWEIYALSAAQLDKNERQLILFTASPRAIFSQEPPIFRLEPFKKPAGDTVATTPNGELENSSRETQIANAVTTALAKLSDTLDAHQQRSAEIVVNSSWRSNTTATFGRFSARDVALKDRVDITRSYDLAEGCVPLLPQFLTSQMPKLQAKHSAAFRIQLFPADAAEYPRIDIYASLERHSKTIHIKEVSLHRPRVARGVSISDTPIDLKFEREDNLLVFRRGEEFSTRFAPLMAQLAQELIGGDFEIVPGVSVSSLFELDMSCLQSDGIDTSVQQGEHLSALVKYARGAVHWIDEVLYQTPSSNPFVIAHTMFSPVREGLHKTMSQSLKLVEKPVLGSDKAAKQSDVATEVDATEESTLEPSYIDVHAPEARPAGYLKSEMDPDNFAALVRTAFDVVSAMDLFAQQKTQAMTARYPSIIE